jgi:hypothetical protein
MATGQMPHPDIFLIIRLAFIQAGIYSDWPLFRLAFIYRYLRPPMQMLFSDESVVFGKTDF